MTLEEFSLAKVGEVDKALLKRFTCADPELDSFLVDDAALYDEYGLTATTVVFRNGDEVPIAFFSLSADCISLNGVELTELGLPFDAPIKFFPAVKITKLAVRDGEQSKGIGEELIKFIQGMVYTDHVSVRLLTVNAVNRPRTLAFYERIGFIQSNINSTKKPGKKEEDRSTILYFKDLYSE
ncbi:MULTISPECIES: GNAT family N-acetyltransferase [unclassified Pseudomonas]|uniref:GNAT family N-acetyltransferase n=1 Tax=unclassified Pseudomonas TaxID=196821 RepID=UPI00244683F2|nr:MULTISPECIES: GNAT family N-acetyltransferase [unclassified Pseudomonas]MDG9928387.1 GNAT family N-acetyltransferase [Pseudomonas sp. GD04042]MDH0482557.1 GNAT family N-acetyltransferase [Pseudomonas sp. GD04015]MDH0604741.1 GNAT family N-acetyltransferase [Pseudomonas sp. GD03869]